MVSCRCCLDLVASGFVATLKTVSMSTKGESFSEDSISKDEPRAGNLVGAELSYFNGVSASPASAF